VRKLTIFLCLLYALFPSAIYAQNLSLNKWGLENKWAYYETVRTLEQNPCESKPAVGRRYRTFAFSSRKEVMDVVADCESRSSQAWEAFNMNRGNLNISYSSEKTSDLSNPELIAFMDFREQRDLYCVASENKKVLPKLYFDFIADSKDRYFLKKIEIMTRRFTECKAGGFIEKEAVYDVYLSPKEGEVTIKDLSESDEKTMTFSEYGRVILRFRSKNFYPKAGWKTGFGEYLIDICFIFEVSGKRVKVYTGKFKIDL
jgi:hypothetical protein